jgi:CheY-like chemotaxis protein
MEGKVLMSESGAHILVVEDEAETSEVLRALLGLEGYTTTCAANGQEALDHLRHGEAPDLILLDLAMPVMDGRQFRQQQLQEPALAGIPVLILSGETNLAHQAASLGAAGYFPKPIFPFDTLLESIRRLAGPAAC